MSKTAHKIYIAILSLIVIAVLGYLIYVGRTYYQVNFEERFYHQDHEALKPSGILGHGLGIFGSLFMIVGMASYMVRKRYRIFSKWGYLKHWLEFHIFLCTLGPILITFHTSFKIGGIVAISFWSMVAVFLSGIIGRFIYLQIPRTIEGRELSLNEVKDMKKDLRQVLGASYNLPEESINSIADSAKGGEEKQKQGASGGFFRKFRENRKTLSEVKKTLKQNKISRKDYKEVVKLVKNELSLNRRIERLQAMQKLFKHWHVIHLPFALVMLVIMFIHIGVTVVFGYDWIF